MLTLLLKYFSKNPQQCCVSILLTLAALEKMYLFNNQSFVTIIEQDICIVIITLINGFGVKKRKKESCSMLRTPLQFYRT